MYVFYHEMKVSLFCLQRLLLGYLLKVKVKVNNGQLI